MTLKLSCRENGSKQFQTDGSCIQILSGSELNIRNIGFNCDIGFVPEYHRKETFKNIPWASNTDIYNLFSFFDHLYALIRLYCKTDYYDPDTGKLSYDPRINEIYGIIESLNTIDNSTNLRLLGVSLDKYLNGVVDFNISQFFYSLNKKKEESLKPIHERIINKIRKAYYKAYYRIKFSF